MEQLITEISKVLPGMQIWLGGPEVSYNAVSVMKKYPQVTGVMCGEGEEYFSGIDGTLEWEKDKVFEYDPGDCIPERGKLYSE